MSCCGDGRPTLSWVLMLIALADRGTPIGPYYESVQLDDSEECTSGMWVGVRCGLTESWGLWSSMRGKEVVLWRLVHAGYSFRRMTTRSCGQGH